VDAFEKIDRPAVEVESRRLIQRVWKAGNSADRFAILDPRLACAELGLSYEPHPRLPWHAVGGSADVAGIFDRTGNRVLIAQAYGPIVERFTAAHEIAHFILHPDAVMHREAPDWESRGVIKPKAEREANYFAACFLVPSNLLREEFVKRFGPADKFSFDESSGFWLTPTEPDKLIGSGVEQRALAVATAKRFGGKSFESLCERFSVSSIAMRIRLVETGLVRGYP
jgi:hypothetical protein